MKKTSPFRIIPWHQDFLAELKALIGEKTRNRPGRAVVVFPHSRPRRYLTDCYRREGKTPLLLPRMMTGEELVARCHAAWSEGLPPRQGSRLDRIALLQRSVERVAAALPREHSLVSMMGRDRGAGPEAAMSRFFPWGVRLAGLMEECFRQRGNLRDIPCATDQVEPFAAALLESLGLIHDYYLEELDSAGLSTPGRDAALVAERAGREPPLPDFLRGRALILAGFVRLTRAEDELFRYLWEQGATVVLHTDGGLARGRSHWSTQDHARWMRQWGADCALRKTPGAEEPGVPEIRFFAGYDLHSQLEELRKTLASRKDGEDAAVSQAVVLPHSGLLMPTLHHLPNKDVNISLGYPLERSLLARLLETVFTLREKRREDGRVHWRPFLELISHPYVRMLKEQSGEKSEDGKDAGPEASVRSLLRLMERKVRNGPRLLRPEGLARELLDEVLGDIDGDAALWSPAESACIREADAALLEHCFRVFIGDWKDVSTLRQTARGLGAVCDLLLQYGGPIWKAFPIDAECLMRLMHNLIPGLEDNCLADQPLSVHTLFPIVRQAMSEERVPFEADPLTGLQVLGMLETRLLRFDRVFLMDLTEDNLPGAPRQDPLLPDSLRGLLGLPDTHERDRLASHTFQRLLAGAKEVWMFWQEGVEQSGLLDSKKVRSRFVEEALWRVERERKQRLTGSDSGPLRSAVFPLSPPPARQRRIIGKSPEIAARMEALLSRPLSPTRLDAYLRCPARFFYEHLCRVKPLDEVRESDDPLGVGMILHETLRRAYAPFTGEMIGPGRPSSADLEKIFLEELGASGLDQSLPAESWLMFRESGPMLLKRCLESRPEGARLLQVEQERKAVLNVDSRARHLSGVLDRVDLRGHGEVILDYKSGRIPEMREDVWEDDAFWQTLAAWNPSRPGHVEAEAKNDTLFALRDRIPSLQLPCYLWLYHQESGALPVNAAWVPLASGGGEKNLFPADYGRAQAETALTKRIPDLLAFVLRHMALSPSLKPREGEHCRYCPYNASC